MQCMKTLLFALGVLSAVLSPGAALGDDAFERALSLASEKRYSDAREVLDPLLQREPISPRARLLHGVLRVREGRVVEAIEVFETLRRDHPDMSEPYNNLAVLYAVEGRLDDARKTLIVALEREPDAVLYANLGDVYTKLAHRAYDRARELEAGGESGQQQEMHTAFAAPTTRSMDATTRPPAGEQEMAGVAPEQGEAATASPDAAPEAKDPPVTPPVAAAVQKPDAESGETREAMAGSESVATGTGSTPAAFCAHAGGFRDRRAVASAALWLQSYGAEVIEVRHEERRIAGSYQVYLPPFENRTQAVAKLREIRQRGVRDVAVIPDGDPRQRNFVRDLPRGQQYAPARCRARQARLLCPVARRGPGSRQGVRDQGTRRRHAHHARRRLDGAISRAGDPGRGLRLTRGSAVTRRGTGELRRAESPAACLRAARRAARRARSGARDPL